MVQVDVVAIRKRIDLSKIDKFRAVTPEDRRAAKMIENALLTYYNGGAAAAGFCKIMDLMEGIHFPLRARKPVKLEMLTHFPARIVEICRQIGVRPAIGNIEEAKAPFLYIDTTP